MVVSLVCLASLDPLVFSWGNRSWWPGWPWRSHRWPGQFGEDWTPGIPGINGINGAKGELWAQGPPGQTGQRGESGTSAMPGTPSVMNWKSAMERLEWRQKSRPDQGECFVCETNNSLRDEINWELQKNYVSEFCFKFFLFIVTFLQECLFSKNFSDTSLHVYWTDVLRITGCDNCFKRWYFTFNVAECAARLPIDGLGYVLKTTSQNIYRVNNIEGHCNNIHKGKVRVGFWVNNCAGYSGSYDAHTGWNSLSRIFIEEVRKPQA